MPTVLYDSEWAELGDESSLVLLDDSPAQPDPDLPPFGSYPVIRLEATGLDTLDVDLDNGFIGQLLDLGDAVTRDVVDDAPDADGTDDTTELIGARNITLAVFVDGTFDKFAVIQRLRSFTHPRRRPTLFVQQSASAPLQQVTVRRSQFTDILEGNEDQPVTVQWVAPLGVLESAALHQQIAQASGGGSEGGFAFSTIPDMTFDMTFTGGTVIGSTTVTNAGTADVYPVLRIYGPCTDPEIENITQGKTLAFTSLSIGAGEFLEIDTRAMTIFYQGDPTDSRYDTLDFPTSAWWTLSPGDNDLRLSPATYSIPSQLVVEWRDAWL